MAASLPAMIYGDSKMATITFAKISGYDTPGGTQGGSRQFDLVSIFGILAIVIQMKYIHWFTLWIYKG